jgi:hypothetical protein
LGRSLRKLEFCEYCEWFSGLEKRSTEAILKGTAATIGRGPSCERCQAGVHSGRLLAAVEVDGQSVQIERKPAQAGAGGAAVESRLMLMWRTCCQQGRSALDLLTQLLRGLAVPLALPP